MLGHDDPREELEPESRSPLIEDADELVPDPRVAEQWQALVAGERHEADAALDLSTLQPLAVGWWHHLIMNIHGRGSTTRREERGEE